MLLRVRDLVESPFDAGVQLSPQAGAGYVSCTLPRIAPRGV